MRGERPVQKRQIAMHRHGRIDSTDPIQHFKSAKINLADGDTLWRSPKTFYRPDS